MRKKTKKHLTYSKEIRAMPFTTLEMRQAEPVNHHKALAKQLLMCFEVFRRGYFLIESKALSSSQLLECLRSP